MDGNVRAVDAACRRTVALERLDAPRAGAQKGGGGSGSSICIFACGKDSSSRQRARCGCGVSADCCIGEVRLTSQSRNQKKRHPTGVSLFLVGLAGPKSNN